MSDLISRADAIEVMACEMYAESQAQGCDVDSWEDFIPEARAWMNDCPSAQPTIEERKTGRWIEVSDDSAPINYACSVCCAGIKHQGFANYCPNCGAKMEVEHD